jgi:DNA invertase Pin-like site-specific DNA recombinase
LFNVLATVAEFESGLIKQRTCEGMRVAQATGRLRGKQPKLSDRQQELLIDLPAPAITAPPSWRRSSA